MTQEAVLAERAAIDAEVEGKTIVHSLDRNAERHGDQPAIHYKEGDWKSLTWKEYRQAVHEAAAGFQALGVGEGEFVAIMAGNRPEHVIADYAAIHSGATAVTIYSTLTGPQIQYIADNCKATVAVLEDLEFMKRWEEIRTELPNLRYVVLMSGAENYDTAEWVLSWDDLLIRGKKRLAEDPDAVKRVAEAITPDTLATLIYTSGTTGTPKGVMISHRNVVWTAECLRRAANIDLGPRMVSYLPLAHIAERLATHYLATYLGGQVWFCPNLASVLEYIQEARPTLFVGVPRVYEKFHSRLSARFAEAHGVKKTLLDRALDANRKRVLAEQEGQSGPMMAGMLDSIVLSKVREQLGMDQVELAITAAAPINSDLILFFQTLGIPLFELYGMSETTGPATTNLPNAFRLGSVGKALPGVEVELAEDDELLMRGGVITEGYYKLPSRYRRGLRRGRLASFRRSGPDRRRWLCLDRRQEEGDHHHGRRQEHRPGQAGDDPGQPSPHLQGVHGRRRPQVPHDDRRTRSRRGAGLGRVQRPGVRRPGDFLPSSRSGSRDRARHG